MRVSPCAYAAASMEDAKRLSRIVTEVTHNHPEGIKGAEAVTVATYMALHGNNILEIQDYINANYYHITFKLDDIRPTYTFDASCQGSVPQALEAFFESTDYEDAIRNAISIGGDSDTLAAIILSVQANNLITANETFKKLVFENNSFPFGEIGCRETRPNGSHYEIARAYRKSM